MDINELIKKYPINDVGEESDPRDYGITFVNIMKRRNKYE